MLCPGKQWLWNHGGGGLVELGLHPPHTWRCPKSCSTSGGAGGEIREITCPCLWVPVPASSWLCCSPGHWETGKEPWRWLKRTDLALRDLGSLIYSASQKAGCGVYGPRLFSHRRLFNLAVRVLLQSDVQKLKLGELEVAMWQSITGIPAGVMNHCKNSLGHCGNLHH